jgi:ATP-dependent Lhr-like helicase
MSPTPDKPLELEDYSRLDRRLREALGDVGHAFFNFPSLFDIQRAAIPRIAEGRNVLVCAATAAGKTEAVIAPLIWRLKQLPTVQCFGPRVLAVSPTRALVADLVARLEDPLGKLGWRCAAQTSDFAGAGSGCEVLVTTPESFDSMLVRRIRREQGETVGHLLANVGAVFVDEAHCFDSTVRGDQLVFLLARLQKLRATALANGWTTEDAMQICAASATVYEPQGLAERLLGVASETIVCLGGRPMDIWTREGCWLRLEHNLSPSNLTDLLPKAPALQNICELLWNALMSNECRKALVFVPSRRECDLLGRELRRYLSGRREISVDSHHGSLSREHRQRAERDFHRQRDAVLVATNTLEVGVDIGDVDIVALVGAPPDTSSLLQRIGRGGRRSGLTRLLPLARNSIEASALGSQIVCAVRGNLEPKHRLRRWDVLPQQVISYIRQNQGGGRSTPVLIDLVAQVWPNSSNSTIADAHIQAWRNDGRLIERRGTLHLAGAWESFAADAKSDQTIHSNIRSASVGLAVRNEFTGEVIGHVTEKGESMETLTIGGRQHRITRHDRAIVVAPVTDEEADPREDTPKYAGRRRRVSETFAAHVRAGCGLSDEQAPLVATSDGLVWFHFGGEVFEATSRALFPHHLGSPIIAGIALRVMREFDSNTLRAFDKTTVAKIVESEGLRLVEDEGLGRFAEELPAIGVNTLVLDLKIGDRLTVWLTTRQVIPAKSLCEWPSLNKLFTCD